MLRTAPSSPRLRWSHARLTLLCAALATLAACGGVEIKPSATLPRPLVVTLPAHVGLVVPGDMRNFVHKETRWGVDWSVDLGEGHERLMKAVLEDTFSEVREFDSVDAARGAAGLKAIFEPRVEQYSFVTARETGGRYYAVTIRYRFDVYSPVGQKVDSLTLTGYGNALAKGMSSGKPLEQASVAAMRDAAAKFLVQFPDLSIGERLARNEAVIFEKNTVSADPGGIDTVPIEETTVEAGTATPAVPGTGPELPEKPPGTTPVAGSPPQPKA